MREYARSKGWWDGETEFNFATVYSFLTTARIESAGSRYCEGKKLLEKSDGLLTEKPLRLHQKEKKVLSSATVYSRVELFLLKVKLLQKQ